MSTENASAVEALKAELTRALTVETLAVARFVSAEKAAEAAKLDAKIAYERICILRAQITQAEMPVESEPIPEFALEHLVGPSLCTDKVVVDGVPPEGRGKGSLEGYLRAYVDDSDRRYHWTGFLYGDSVPNHGKSFVGSYAEAVRWLREIHAKYSVLSMVELAAA